MAMADELEKYVRANAADASVIAVTRLLSDVDLLLFGETHVWLDIKARFFASLVRYAKTSRLLQYFASEHFINDTRTDGAMIGEYLERKRPVTKLVPHLRKQVAIFDAVRDSLPQFGVIFAGTKEQFDRDRRIHAHFASGRGIHLKARRFGSKAKGIFHLGADHAARVANRGSDKTTCERITADGLRAHVIRLTCGKKGSADVGDAVVFDAGESALVRERRTAVDDWDRWIDLVPIMQRVAGEKAVIVNLRVGRSPFEQVLDSGGSAVFADRFDSILHLPK